LGARVELAEYDGGAGGVGNALLHGVVARYSKGPDISSSRVLKLVACHAVDGSLASEGGSGEKVGGGHFVCHFGFTTEGIATNVSGDVVLDSRVLVKAVKDDKEA